MTKLLQHLWATILFSVLLLLVVAYGFHAPFLDDPERYGVAVFRFLYVLCGIMWIGLLFFVHFVLFQVLERLPAELEPSVYHYLVPEAFFWLRFAALFTVAIGLALGFLEGNLAEALLLKGDARVAGLGMWLALFMAASSWVLVWPNLKRAANEDGVSPARRARALWLGMIFSRINLLLSLPMLYCMVMAAALAGG